MTTPASGQKPAGVLVERDTNAGSRGTAAAANKEEQQHATGQAAVAVLVEASAAEAPPAPAEVVPTKKKMLKVVDMVSTVIGPKAVNPDAEDNGIGLSWSDGVADSLALNYYNAVLRYVSAHALRGLPGFAWSDFGRFCDACEYLKKSLDDAAVFKLFAAEVKALAQQPSNTEAATRVVVLGGEVSTALGQTTFVTPVHMDSLLPDLVCIFRGFNQMRSDAFPEIKRRTAALEEVWRRLLQVQQNLALTALTSSTRPIRKESLLELQYDIGREQECVEAVLTSLAELQAEMAQGKVRMRVAATFEKLLVFQVPQLFPISRFRVSEVEIHAYDELRDYENADWEAALSSMLHSAICYGDGSILTVGVDGETGKVRGPTTEERGGRPVRALRRLLACGVSPGAKEACRVHGRHAMPCAAWQAWHDALMACHVQSKSECAKELLRAGASVTQQLADRMLPLSDGQKTQTRVMVERALEPWSPANHELLPEAARRFVVQLLLIGHQLSARPDHAPLATPWLEYIMPAVVNRDAH